MVSDGAHRPALIASVGGPERAVEACGELGQAMARVSEGGLDLVVLDLSVGPGDVGLAVLDAARIDAPDAAVIVLASDPAHLGPALNRGALCALVRPGDPRVLRHLCEVALQAQVGVPAGQLRAALESIQRALTGQHCVGRLLEWTLALIGAHGAAHATRDRTGRVRLTRAGLDHPEQVTSLAMQLLDEPTPESMEGTERDRRRLNLPPDARIGPALACPVETERSPPSLVVAIREGGAAPFPPRAAEILAALCAHAALSLDRLDSGADLTPPVDVAGALRLPIQHLSERIDAALAQVRQLEGSARAVIGLIDARDAARGVLEAAEDLSMLGRARTDGAVPVDKIVRLAMRRARGLEGKDELDFVTEIEPVKVRGHAGLIAHAVQAVLDGAVHDAVEDVIVRAWADRDTVHLVIQDDGHRAGLAPTTAALAEARRILDQAGGTLSYRPADTRGTRAELTLPRARR